MPWFWTCTKASFKYFNISKPYANINLSRKVYFIPDCAIGPVSFVLHLIFYRWNLLLRKRSFKQLYVNNNATLDPVCNQLGLSIPTICWVGEEAFKHPERFNFQWIECNIPNDLLNVIHRLLRVCKTHLHTLQNEVRLLSKEKRHMINQTIPVLIKS